MIGGKSKAIALQNQSEKPIYLVWDGTGTPPTIKKIEIPELSDEEIKEKSKEYAYFNPDNDMTIHFYEGAKWYREQLKQKHEQK